MDAGAVILIVVMILLVPAILTGGLVVAGILGWTLKDEAEDRHAGSELVDLNR